MPEISMTAWCLRRLLDQVLLTVRYTPLEPPITTCVTGATMTLEEIRQSGAAEKRVERMKAKAKAAKEHAKLMKANADKSAEQLKMQQSRQRLSQLHRSSVGTSIKPYC